MISFAIPFYRGRALLEKAVQSVLNQTATDWKLLVCDDGTEPGVREFIAGLTDSRIRYVHNPARLGMVGNWNRCLELAETDHVTLLHGDDALLPNYAAIMSEAAGRYPRATAVFCRSQVIDAQDRRVFSFPDFYKGFLMPSRREPITLAGEDGLTALLRGNFLFCPTVCFRKSALGAARFDPKWEMVQDLDLWSRLLMDGHEIVGLPEFGYAYRRHAANSTTAYTRNALRFREESALYAALAERGRKMGWENAARIAGRAAIVKLNLTYCLLKDLAGFQFTAAGEKGRLLGALFGRSRQVR